MGGALTLRGEWMLTCLGTVLMLHPFTSEVRVGNDVTPELLTFQLQDGKKDGPI